jgi:hypothetical protein
MRLTNDIRDSLAREILRHRFSDEVDAHIGAKVAFAGEVYCDIYRKSDRDKMDAMPNGWLPENSALSAQFGASSAYDTVYFSGHVDTTLRRCRKKTDKPTSPIQKRVLEKHRIGCAKVYAADHKICIRREALIAAEKDLASRISAAEAQANAALASVTTLPAIPVSKLNEMFKLPVAEAA